MNDHVPKPVNPEELYAVLLRWLRLSGVERLPPIAPEARGVAPAVDREGGDSGVGADTVIDWPALEARFADRLDFAAKLLNSALDYYADTPAELERCIAVGDLAGIGRVAHGLKSTGGNLMARRLRDTARQTDLEVQHHNADEAVRLAGELHGLLAALLAESRHWLAAWSEGEGTRKRSEEQQP
jgi:HPt (histidine-containing phosphotransfer) domain-containing protein